MFMRRRLVAVVLALPLFVSALHSQVTPARDTAPRPQPLPTVRIINRPSDLKRLGGSATILDSTQLTAARVFTVEEALRKVPGIHTRIEDGLGLRPHIGMRGLDPLRSRKVLLLEDGIPFVLAPYGDADSYYHPPIDRFSQVEVVKGAGQILYGPSTIGGVINYISAPIPARAAGSLQLAGGPAGILTGVGRWGMTVGKLGLAVDAIRKQSDLARDSSNGRISDFTLRAQYALAAHAFTFKLNAHDENTRAPYTGLTEAEWAANPRFNPFLNDRFTTRRYGASLAHLLRVGGAELTTTGYTYQIQRENWRQSGNSAQRPNDRSDPSCGGIQNLLTTCGNEGRVRNYNVSAIEERVRAPLPFGVGGDIEFGGRLLWERQDRLQLNAATPTGRAAGPSTNPNSGLVENNVRRGMGASAFVQPRLVFGAWSVTPGVRIERVSIYRQNLLPTPASPNGVSGDTALLVIIPGVGVTWTRPQLTLFAGLHRGFAPPRPEDIINNTTGGTATLGPELSWNSEVGARGRIADGLSWEATAFRMDFENQIVPQSTAGGTGTAVTNAGRTLHQGGELSVTLDRAARPRSLHRVLASVAATWLPVARYVGPRVAFVGTVTPDTRNKVYPDQNGIGTRTRVVTTDNRLPYAPRSLLTASAGYSYGTRVDVRLEGVYTGRQFTDPVNTSVVVPDGQQGPIGDALIYNVSANYSIPGVGAALFITAKNLTDRLVLVDRSRGLMPAMGRVVYAGVRWGW